MLTIFKNHKNKLFYIDNDSALFSIMQCQSITVPKNYIEFEISLAEDDGFKQVDCYEFYKGVNLNGNKQEVIL
jgi:hypothetical protein